MKTISFFLSFVNSLLAGLLITFSLSTHELFHPGVWWPLTKLLASSTVVILGVVTWIANVREANVGLLLLGSVCVIVLGVVMIMWTLHIATTSGHMEYYMAGYGASLMAQGMASLLGFGEDARGAIA